MKKFPFHYKIVVALFIEAFIGFVDSKTGNEFSFTILYILPVFLLALQKESTKLILVTNSLFAATIWFLVYSHENSLLYSFLNALLRFVVFSTISLISQLIIHQQAKLKLQNEELKNLNEELKTLNEEKNNILGIAAHDIRNGIGVAYSFSQLLFESDYIKKNLKKEYSYIELIHKSSINLLTMLGNILDISKIESGTITLKTKKNDYVDFVKNRIDLMQYIAAQKHIEIVTDFRIESLIIEFDAIYFQEVIDNLLSNAIKYSFPDSKINVTVSLNGTSVFTEIRDSGVGIPEKELAKLFKPFSKTSAKPTSGEYSTGLGLAIVKKIVEMHKGTIGVKSKMNEGSVFYFSLPLN